MLTKPFTLASGRVITLEMPDTYALIAAEPIAPDVADIPNTALSDILDLIVYGGFIKLPTAAEDDTKRAAESRRYLRARWEVAALCCPDLKLRGGGSLTPRDITPRDLDAIVAWFQNGGSDGVPAAEGAEPESGTPANSDGAALVEVAE